MYFIFDFDGVLLNSNKIKNECFYNITVKYFGQKAAVEILNLNKKLGGISRQEKFQFIIDKYGKKKDIKSLCEIFSKTSMRLLKNCDKINLNYLYKNKNKSEKWGIISGANQGDLKTLVNIHFNKIKFDLGVWGSPQNKKEIYYQNFQKLNCTKKIYYFGDSYNDYLFSKETNINFIFIKEWSQELPNIINKIKCLSFNNLTQAVPYLRNK